MKRLRDLGLVLLAMALTAAVVVALGIAGDAEPTGAQGVAPTATPTPTSTVMAQAAGVVLPADGIRVWQLSPGQGEVTVFWDQSDAQAAAWVAYVNLSQWLREADSTFVWSDAIRWTAGQWVGTAGRDCQQSTCPQDTTQVSGLTLGDTYIFTVVKSADGTTGFVWPDPVWHSLVVSTGLPTSTPMPTLTPNVCDGPFAAIFPQCGEVFPTVTPTATPTPTATATQVPGTGSGDICDGPFAEIFPQCN